ncbi:MAG: N-acetylmuramoyl-L-alanine amidase [Bacteroidetes bacterium]|nr:N-acetylmuramoyl-L-alanine amidase [Bacteroidota bacterium]
MTVFRKKGSYEIKTVVIDPGHGGHDPGCSGSHSKEKQICLAVGKYFAEAIRQNFPDVKVIMTRSTDVFIPLDERASIATRNKADLFVSIHCNAIPNASKTMGTETYVLGLHATEANLEVAKRENASILYEENYQETYGYDPNSPEAHILFSMFQNAFMEQSIRFAEKVQNNSSGEADRKNRGVKQAGFLVLRHATMPSVLVETGFLTNATEENYLRSQTGQKSMANALLLAFRDYKREMEGTDAVVEVKKLDIEKSEAASESLTASLEYKPEIKPDIKEKPIPPVKEEAAIVVPVKQEAEATPPLYKPEKKKNMPPVEARKEEAVVVTPSKKTNESPAHAGKIIPSNPVLENAKPEKKPDTQTADIQYRVQLAASPTHFDTSTGKWAKVEYLIEVTEENNLFKYQVRNFATLEAANSAKQKLRSLGFNDAFVAYYQNGKRVK